MTHLPLHQSRHNGGFGKFVPFLLAGVIDVVPFQEGGIFFDSSFPDRYPLSTFFLRENRLKAENLVPDRGFPSV